MSNAETMGMLFMSWGIREAIGQNLVSEDYHNESFIYKVLSKKLQAVGIFDKVEIPDEMYMMCELAVQGNPGYCQLIMHNVLMNRQQKDKLTSFDFALTYPTRFPDIDDPVSSKKLLELWDAQKDNEGRNKCDTYEWWEEAYKAKFQKEVL